MRHERQFDRHDPWEGGEEPYIEPYPWPIMVLFWFSAFALGALFLWSVVHVFRAVL